jgi:hypothetical protein
VFYPTRDLALLDVAQDSLSRQDIGDSLGLTVETVSRTLAQLDRDGPIEMIAARNVKLLEIQHCRRQPSKHGKVPNKHHSAA